MKLPKRLVVKVGSNVLTTPQGGLDEVRLSQLCHQLEWCHQQGIQTILISSGAVAAGKDAFKPNSVLDTVSQRQVFAALGQVKLLHLYDKVFSSLNRHCAQVLVTKEDFRDRSHYLNLRNCFEALLAQGIIPIVNENDTVAVTELMFTDNDELSGLVASMMDVEFLMILSNVDGIFTGHPSEPDAQLIRTVQPEEKDLSQHIAHTKSTYGRGGMLTKTNIAHKVALDGIDVVIANGKKDDIILAVLEGKADSTHFIAHKRKSGVKKWMAFGQDFAKASIVINAGAMTAMLSGKAISILPIGVVGIEGSFQKDDLIHIKDELGQIKAVGKASYQSDKLKEALGLKNKKPVVHYNYLYVFG